MLTTFLCLNLKVKVPNLVFFFQFPLSEMAFKFNLINQKNWCGRSPCCLAVVVSWCAPYIPLYTLLNIFPELIHFWRLTVWLKQTQDKCIWPKACPDCIRCFIIIIQRHQQMNSLKCMFLWLKICFFKLKKASQIISWWYLIYIGAISIFSLINCCLKNRLLPLKYF